MAISGAAPSSGARVGASARAKRSPQPRQAGAEVDRLVALAEQFGAMLRGGARGDEGVIAFHWTRKLLK
jgi:hypothetical protein